MARQTITCQHCGVTFYGYPRYPKNPLKFCSRQCAALAKTIKPRTPFKCKKCDTVFYRYARPDRPSNNQFCSLKCKYQSISKTPLFERFLRYVTIGLPNECWEWQGLKSSDGYGRLRISSQLGKESAHRLAFQFFVGAIPEGQHVLHSCDNPACVNPAHLWLGTHQDNMKDCAVKERMHPKLTAEQVRAIRLDQRSYREIALDYGVHASAIAAIKWGINHKHVS